MSNFFDRFTQITGKDLPDPTNLSTEEKSALIHALRMSGERMPAIAKYLGCSRQYAYKLENEAKKDLLQNLECKTYLDIFVDKIYELESDIAYYRKLQSSLKGGYGLGKELDEDGNEIKRHGSPREVVEYGRLIQKYQQMVIELQTKVGMIPTHHEDIYGSIKDRDPSNISEEVSLGQKSENEVTELLLNKLQARRPSIKDNVLKQLQNENVL